MKYNIIGDIHGRKIYKQLLRDDCTNIFIGDYFDPYDGQTYEECETIFKEILRYKEEHPETILLVGNHDMQYLIGENYSRKMYKHAQDIKDLFNENHDKFQICTSFDDVIVSHAGVSNVWYLYRITKQIRPYPHIITETNVDNFEEYYIERFNYGNWDVDTIRTNMAPIYNGFAYYWDKKCEKWVKIDDDIETIVKNINQIWKDEDERTIGDSFSFGWNSHREDIYGDSPQQSPVWIRPGTLSEYGIGLKQIKQVVGHTQMPGIKMNLYSSSIYAVDCLGQKPQSLIYDTDTKTFAVNELEDGKEENR